MIAVTFKGNPKQRIRIAGIELKHNIRVELPDGIEVPNEWRNSNEFIVEGGTPVPNPEGKMDSGTSTPKPATKNRAQKMRIGEDRIKKDDDKSGS